MSASQVMWGVQCVASEPPRPLECYNRPIANFSSHQRDADYASITIFNTLPASTAKLVKDKKQFISTLKRFSIFYSFYSIKKYLNYEHEIKIDDSSIRNAL
jgi:hypothetical protein